MNTGRGRLTPTQLAEVEDLVMSLFPDANLSRGEKQLLAEGVSARWNINAVKSAVKEQRRRQGKGTGAYAKPDIGAICRIARENEQSRDTNRGRRAPGEMADGDEVAAYYRRVGEAEETLYGRFVSAERNAWEMHSHLMRIYGPGEKMTGYREHLIRDVFGTEIAEQIAYYERDYAGYMLDRARDKRERAAAIMAAKKPEGVSPSSWARGKRFRKDRIDRLLKGADACEAGLRAVMDREQRAAYGGETNAVRMLAGVMGDGAGGDVVDAEFEVVGVGGSANNSEGSA